MSYRPQRDPFDDGIESLISAMNVSHRLPDVKEPDMESLGKKIIDNAKTRPKFARELTELYTNEDSWLSNFLKQQMAAAKPVPKPEYFGGGHSKSDEPDQDTMSEVGEGGEGGESGSEDGSSEDGDEGERVETTTQKVEGDITMLDFQELTTISRENQVRALSLMKPRNATDIVIEKKGKTSSVKIYENSEEDIANVRSELKRERDTLIKENNVINNNMIKTLNYIVNNKTSIKVTPSNIKSLSAKQKGSPKKRGRPAKQKSGGGSRSRSASSEKPSSASSEKPSGGGSTDAQMAVYGELTKE